MICLGIWGFVDLVGDLGILAICFGIWEFLSRFVWGFKGIFFSRFVFLDFSGDLGSFFAICLGICDCFFAICLGIWGVGDFFFASCLGGSWGFFRDLFGDLRGFVFLVICLIWSLGIFFGSLVFRDLFGDLGIWGFFRDLFGDLGIRFFAICFGIWGFVFLVRDLFGALGIFAPLVWGFLLRFVWGVGDFFSRFVWDLGICLRDLFGDLMDLGFLCDLFGELGIWGFVFLVRFVFWGFLHH